MSDLKRLYNKTSTQTQQRLQDIFNRLELTLDNLYNIASDKTKKMIDNEIIRWKEEKLLKGYFGVLCNNIYGRTRVKNSEILELLIYSVYIEEQNKLNKQELNIMYSDANYYYEEGQKEVNKTLKKKKDISIIDMALFLYLMDQPNYSGLNWKQYIEATIQYNAQQIYKQAIIDIQQQKDLEIDSDEFQRLIQQQNRQRLSINNGKISGAVDMQMIGINNLAKVEGIKTISEDNSKVRFIAVTDENSTDMCQSMNDMEFYINKENKFDRYWGETQKELKLMPIKVQGLVLGVNLPPIIHHFHYCRSTITYLPPINNQENISFDEKNNIIVNGLKILKNNKLNKINRMALFENINQMQKVLKDFSVLKNKNIIYEVVKYDDGSAMSTRPTKNGKHILEINQNIFNSNIKEYYNQGTSQKHNVRNSTYKDIAIHEAGHMVTFELMRKINRNNLQSMMFDYDNSITSNKIMQKAFNNLGIRDTIQKERAIKNVSNYAITNSDETIAETFVDYYCNGKQANKLSKEILNVMKGMI